MVSGAPPSMWRCILACLLYGTVSSLMTFSNKALSSNYSFGYPLFLLWVQMAVTQVGLLVMHQMGWWHFVYPKITPGSLLAHLPLTTVYVFNAILAISTLQAMSIPTYGVLKRMGPIFIILIHWVINKFVHLKGSRAAAAHDLEMAEKGTADDQGSVALQDEDETLHSGVVAAVTIIVVGTLLAGHSDMHLSPLVLRMAFGSNVCQAIYVTMVEDKHKSVSAGGFYYGPHTDPTLGLLAHNSLIAIPMLAAVVCCMGMYDGGVSWGFMDQSRHSWELLGVFAVATTLGCSLNYTMFLCIRVNSALTTSLVGHAKTAVQTVVGFFVLAKDVDATVPYVAGVAINACGALMFTLAKYWQTEKRKGNVGGLGFWAWLARGVKGA
mmetsp:Transcript_24905/g.59828  ORF Transcript_24905/g.59828 Transcript_24905/m.59828 type:complete len:381 (+) Transcript_24905:174-1316(+)